MPKAPVTRKDGEQGTHSNAQTPYTRSRPTPGDSASKSSQTREKRNMKDPKQSHLYTDDNPSTTLHGTGFKDAATAERTLSLISKRSLTYQWQVVNTMYHRAKGHPSMKKGNNTKDIEAAMEMFHTWLDDTYPAAKSKRNEEGRDFKPLLKKELVEKYLGRIRRLTPSDEEDETDRGGTADMKEFSEMYVSLAKGKRLANTLVDEKHPEEYDWEILREKALTRLKDNRHGEGEDGLWNKDGQVSEWHLRCIAWAWSPVSSKRLQ